ncbi:MAG: GAF domain-containing protein [Clostridia bacterium]
MSDDHGDVLRLVNSRLSLPLVYAGVRYILSGRMPADNMFVSLLEGNGMRFPFYIDEFEPEDTLDFFPKEGWTGYVVDRKDRYWSSRDPAPPPEINPIGQLPEDWLGVPLVDREGSVMGVLAVQTYEAGSRYTDEDERFIQFTAAALSVAIQLARQDADIAVRRIAALVDEIVDLDDLYPRIHQILQTVIPAARKNVIFAKVDESAGVFRPVYWLDEKDDHSNREWPLDYGLSGYIYHVRRKSFIYEKDKTPLPPGFISTGTAPCHWLGAPLYSQDHIIGVVVIQSYTPSEAITREDEYVLNSICPYIAAAISHTELFNLRLRKT